MNEEKYSENKISISDNKFFIWLDNYWYHYKWPTIVVAFFVVVFGVCLIQSITTEKNDILITYAGPAQVAPDDAAAIESVFDENLPDGFGNKGTDGKAGLISYVIYSKDQIKALEADKKTVDTAFNSDQYSTLNSQYKTGNGSIYLLDRWLYDEILKDNENVARLKPLSEVFGETPAGAIDAYGIRLGDTEIYKNSPALQVLPEDTIICLHEKIVGQKDYDKEIEVFKNIAKIATVSNDEE